MKTQFISLLIALLAGLLPLQAQQVSISGIVTDKKLNEPIIGASVVVKVQATVVSPIWTETSS